MQTGLALAFLTVALVSAAPVDSWPQFRGAQSAGVADDDPSLPDRWNSTENVAWKVDIPGTGWSSPIVAGNRIFVTAVIPTAAKEPPKKGLYFGGERKAPEDEHRWTVYCIDFDSGKVLWEREVYKGVPQFSRHLKNSYASETPATDGERVYVYFGNVGVFVLDLNGKPVWSKRFDPVKTRNGWGTAASPVLYQNRLYIVNDNDDHSYLMALDKKTGDVIWKVDRNEGTNWSTPFIWESGKRTEVITSGTKRVRSYDLDGKVLWELGGMSSIVIPTPFTRHGLLYVASGYVGDQSRPVYAIRSGASGDVSLKPSESSNEFVAWSLPQGGPYNPSPLVYGDLYYTLFDRGFLTAHDAKTGREIYGKQRLDSTAGAFTASPWAYNGKLFLLSEDGDTFVVQAGPEYKLLWKNSVDEMCMATPAVARGSVIIRTSGRVYRIARAAK